MLGCDMGPPSTVRAPGARVGDMFSSRLGTPPFAKGDPFQALAQTASPLPHIRENAGWIYSLPGLVCCTRFEFDQLFRPVSGDGHCNARGALERWSNAYNRSLTEPRLPSGAGEQTRQNKEGTRLSK